MKSRQGRRLRTLQRKLMHAAAVGNVELVRNILKLRDYDDWYPANSTGKKRRKGGREVDERKNPQKEARIDGEGTDFASTSGRVSSRQRSTKWCGPSRERTLGKHDRRDRRSHEWEMRDNWEVTGGSHSGSDVGDRRHPETDSSSEETCPRFGYTRRSLKLNERAKQRRNSYTREEVRRKLVNCGDAEGLSPLHHACYAGSEVLVDFLLFHGANVNARDFQGNTPSHVTALLGMVSILAILEEFGGDLHRLNDKKQTAIDILRKKQETAAKASIFEELQGWSSRLAEELSGDEGSWWAGDWSDGNTKEEDLTSTIAEEMSEIRQGRRLYDDSYCSMRDYLRQSHSKQERTKVKKPKAKVKHPGAGPEEENIARPKDMLEKDKILVDSERYIRDWKLFEESYNICLSYRDMPFPVEEGREGDLEVVLLQGVPSSKCRDVLRREILKWHPDKFLQKWNTKLQGPDRDQIVARVNATSQAIHQIYIKMAHTN